MPEIITIPAIDKQKLFKQRIRVAAYCRVSSSSYEQEDSLVNQTIYYHDLIASHSEWELVGIFADKGITGTKKERKEFLRLIEVCKKGKVDLILVKSISRFARNIIDCLDTIELLRSFGVSIYFEKDNINTQDRRNDILLSILGSCAEQESLSISRNLKLGVRARMEAGLYRPASFAYGYKKSDIHFMDIDETKLEIVRRILCDYKSKGYNAIAQELNQDNIPCLYAHRWSASVIRNIIKSEKYIGDALLQKTYSPNTFPFEKRRNTGELRQVYYKKSHPAIISKAQYDENQNIREYTKFNNGIDPTKVNYRNRYLFTGKITCDECGGKFRRKTVRRTSIYWMCSHRLESNEFCKCKAIKESVLKLAFIEMVGKLKTNPQILKPIIMDCNKYNERINANIAEVINNINESKKQSLELNRKYSDKEIDFAFYIQEQSKIESQLKNHLSLLKERTEIDDLKENTLQIINELKSAQTLPDQFCEVLFENIVDEVIVESNGIIGFILKNGLRLNEKRGDIQ